MSKIDTCDWHPEHDHHTDRPAGQRCGAAATHRIEWSDGSRRFSFSCDAHHAEFDPSAPSRQVVRICRWGDVLSISLFFAFIAHDAFTAAYKMGIDGGLPTFDVHVAAMVIARQHVNDLIACTVAS